MDSKGLSLSNSGSRCWTPSWPQWREMGFLGGLVATIFLDIIYISIFYSSFATVDTGRFSAGMAIFSLLLKPFSCCFIYHMHRERGGELPLRPDFFGPSHEHSAYQTIDTPDSPAAPFASPEDKGQAAPRGY
ncbi:type-1 angiotensin II receptor-associated protein isoform X2 [Peromyscus californicus insignis]|uniref:type-1 angiotensin II receptor-associated protein isoform X2 n=1 Tax=Peromyscus californicus insignis TaxID=564181 RepID=UPI0022A75DFD|nr:type-1 angiotensin II receptor-associated protein isoform X2 [Peromyscus californicus insignis]